MKKDEPKWVMTDIVSTSSKSEGTEERTRNIATLGKDNRYVQSSRALLEYSSYDKLNRAKDSSAIELCVWYTSSKDTSVSLFYLRLRADWNVS